MRALITGAGRGIGRAVALALAKEGATLALLARSEGELEETARKVRARGGEASVHPVDLAVPGAIAPVVNAAIASLGGVLDAVINNAGLFDMRPIEGMPLKFWDRMLAVNLTAPMLVSQASIPALKLGTDPAIVNVASVAAETGFGGNSAYCASKFGLKGLSEALRYDLEPLGIAVRTVYPGATATTIFEAVDGDWDLKSMDTPESVAALITSALKPGAKNDLRMAPGPN